MSEALARHQFFSVAPSCNYVFRDGTFAHFLNHRFVTDNRDKANQLFAEIEFGHPDISQKLGEETVSEEAVISLAELKQLFITEYLAEQEAKKGSDAGTTELQKLNVTGTQDVVAALGSSDSGLDLSGITNATAAKS